MGLSLIKHSAHRRGYGTEGTKWVLSKCLNSHFIILESALLFAQIGT